jgi:hypothetical protein
MKNNVDIDSIALEASGDIMGYFFLKIPGVQLRAKIQERITEAMSAYRPAKVQGAATDELPKLPAPFGSIDIYSVLGNVNSVDGFTADQMRGYAIDYAMQLGRASLAADGVGVQGATDDDAPQGLVMPPFAAPAVAYMHRSGMHFTSAITLASLPPAVLAQEWADAKPLYTDPTRGNSSDPETAEVGSIGDDPEFVGRAIAAVSAMFDGDPTGEWNRFVIYLDSIIARAIESAITSPVSGQSATSTQPGEKA